jgi:N-acyl-D-amino-acid deacylase
MPDTLFRIASISKTITSVAVLLAVQDELGGLKLDTPALPFLQLEPAVLPGGRPDPRLDRITLRHLLQHTGGWDRKQSGDPMFRYFEASRALGIPSPPPLRQFLRWALARPLENEPGTKHAYSNLGFSLLGRAIERAAGRGYEQFCRDRVLRPAGCARMRIGRDRRRDRLPGETVYYDTDDKKVANIHEADGEREVPSPYGFATMENMDAFGGWVGSTVDLLRFLRAVEPDGPSPLLNRGAYDLMLQRPAGLAGRDSQGKELPVYYGLGWNVTPLSGGLMNYGHGGAMPGTSSLFYRIQSGTGWAAIFNARPEKGNLNSLLYRAAAQVKSWPEKDLFPDFA